MCSSDLIGDARLGLMVAQGSLAIDPSDAAFLRGRLDRPSPRVKLGQALRGLAHASVDVSDGLLADLGHICEQSRAGATVQAADVPVSASAERALAAVPQERANLATFGDDYELLFTAAASDRGRIQGLAASLGVALTKIGTITEGDGVRVLDTQGRPVEYVRKGFQHF